MKRYNRAPNNMACKGIVFLSAIFSITLFSATTTNAENIVSLRGPTAIEAPSTPTEITRYQTEAPPIQRGFVQQPPLIPHSIKGYVINLRSNKCLTCHSWTNAKTSGATKISLTHFKNRDGVELADVSPRRYFCVQCHVPQKNVPVLIANEFTPVEALR